MKTTHSPSSTPPRAVLFDAYGTLFDVYSVALLAEQLFPGHGERFATHWRDKQIDCTRLLTMGGRYQPFWDVTRAALKWTAQRLGLTLGAVDEDRLMNQYRHLSAFPENREVLQALKDRGIRAGILSNGDPDMLGVAVRSAGLSDLIDPLLSVHERRRFKPDPAAYAIGPVSLGLPARDILFVSSNSWDAVGATWYGYTTLWINRSGGPIEPLDTAPTRIGTGLRQVLDFFPLNLR